MLKRTHRISDGLILLVIDSSDLRGKLHTYLETCYDYHDGIYFFNVLPFKTARLALAASLGENTPVLMVIDNYLADMNGIELAKKFRDKEGDNAISCIFLTKQQLQQPYSSSDFYNDYYLNKPFALHELEQKINLIRQNMHISYFKNPWTHLPSGKLIEEKLKQFIVEKDWFLLNITLQNLDEIEEEYNWDIAKRLIKFTADCIEEVTNKNDISDSFIGHTRKNEFMIISKSEKLKKIQDEILIKVNNDKESDNILKQIPTILIDMIKIEGQNNTFSKIKDVINKIEQSK